MSSPTRRIHHNPLGGAVWLAEKGQPWRAQSEFEQIQLDEKAKEEFQAKRIVRMAKQCAEGIKAKYGREYDFAVLQFCIKDAIDLSREDLPKELKPQVSQERATELKRIYNAAVAFNIPLLKKLLDVSTSQIQTQSMGSTRTIFDAATARKDVRETRADQDDLPDAPGAPLGQCERREYNQKEETLEGAREFLQRPKLPCALVQPAKQHHLDIGRVRCNGRRRGRDDDAAAVRRYLLRPGLDPPRTPRSSLS